MTADLVPIDVLAIRLSPRIASYLYLTIQFDWSGVLLGKIGEQLPGIDSRSIGYTRPCHQQTCSQRKEINNGHS